MLFCSGIIKICFLVLNQNVKTDKGDFDYL